MIRASRRLVATILVAVASTACGSHGAAPLNRVGSGPGGAAGSVSPAGSLTSGASPTDLIHGQSTQDDMRTFVYAFDDAANLTAETAALTKTAQSVSASLIVRDYDAAKSYALQMLGQANDLEASAMVASERLRPLGPTDDTLIRARKDGLVTFDLAAEYAAAGTDVAEAALVVDAGAAPWVGRQASSILGTTGQLSSSYAALTEELESWASANPSAAARAIALYA